MTLRKVDDNGFITIENNPISRSGVFPYLGRSIGAPEASKMYMVYRPAAELEDPECQASFRNLPLIDDHGTVLLGPKDDGFIPAEEKGVHGATGDAIDFRDGVLYSNLKIFSEKVKTLLDSGKKALSLGYRCVYENTPGTFAGQAYDYVQRSLRGNHIALVDEARCDVAVLDHHFTFDHLDISTKEKDLSMDTDKKENGKDEGELTLESLAARIDALVTAVEKLTPAEQEEAAEAVEEGVEAAEETVSEAEADTETSAETVDTKGKGMDAADLKRLTAKVAKIEKDGIKSLVQQVAQRDKLANQLSGHIGTFDHSEMTLDEVAAYGAKKLGLKVPAGSEKVALDGFLHGRGNPAKAVGMGLDHSGKSKASQVTKFINSAK